MCGYMVTRHRGLMRSWYMIVILIHLGLSIFCILFNNRSKHRVKWWMINVFNNSWSVNFFFIFYKWQVHIILHIVIWFRVRHKYSTRWCVRLLLFYFYIYVHNSRFSIQLLQFHGPRFRIVNTRRPQQLG